MKAYKGTSVNWAKSQTAIIKILTARNIYQTRFTNLQDKFVVEFLATLDGHSKPIGVRVVVPLGYIGEVEKKRQQDLNRLHRVLFYHIKAKFVAIDAGLSEFMEEFMPHLIITDKNGNSTTMGQTLLPQYTESIEKGEQKDFKLLE